MEKFDKLKWEKEGFKLPSDLQIGDAIHLIIPGKLRGKITGVNYKQKSLGALKKFDVSIDLGNGYALRLPNVDSAFVFPAKAIEHGKDSIRMDELLPHFFNQMSVDGFYQLKISSDEQDSLYLKWRQWLNTIEVLTDKN